MERLRNCERAENRAIRPSARPVRRNSALKALLVAAACLAFGLAASDGRAAEPLVRLAGDFRWPHVSSLLWYDGRLWFANGVKYVNHNSADIWSYEPAAGRLRYERHLFSQDAGDPAVHRGLLYWPFEDPRFSAGRGEFMVTDSAGWRWGMLAPPETFHVHAMVSSGSRLYAATSAWEGRLQLSTDGGASWTSVYAHSTPDGEVSRIVALAVFGGTLYGGLVAGHDPVGTKLLRWSGGTFRPVEGWPGGTAVPRLTAFGGWLYGQNNADGRSDLWRTDGRTVEPVPTMAGRDIRGMAAGAGALWLASGASRGGELWRSTDGLRWELAQRFPGISLHAVHVQDEAVYVGGETGGRGILLGPAGAAAQGPGPLQSQPRVPAPATAGPDLPVLARDPAPVADLAALTRRLADPAAYGRQLRGAFAPFALSRDAATGRGLAALIAGPLPDVEVKTFGGRTVPAARMARWYLLWAMAHNGHGRVPPVLLSAPWTSPPNPAEKYLEAVPAAAWAAAELGQDDDDTVAALVARLGRAGDPDWLTGDIVGALTVLTGQRFAYDTGAWQRWWQARR